MGLLGGLAGLWGSQGAAGDLKDLAKENRKAIGAANTSNRSFADQLLAMSHPDMSGSDLGNLMFSQGENEAQRQHDTDLATTLRQNLRSGAPLSTTDVIGGFDRQNANQWADRRSSATLQGLMGVLPSGAAIQTAGSLGRALPETMDPSLMAESIGLNNSALPNFLNAIDPSSMLTSLFGGGQQPTGYGNTANINQSGDIMAAYGNGSQQPQGNNAMLLQLLPYLLG